MKYRRKRKAEIKSLREYIDEEFKVAADSAKTPQEKGEAEQMVFSMCQWEMNQLSYLEQEDVLTKLKTAPFEVPDAHWYHGGYGHKKLLTDRGHAWARHELKKIRNADIEFWFKLVVPLIALILSIFALVKNRH